MAIFVNLPIRILVLLPLLKIRNILCKAGFKVCRAAHVGLVGTGSMVGTDTLFCPWGLCSLTYVVKTTKRQNLGLRATSVPSMGPVAIVVLLLEVEQKAS